MYYDQSKKSKHYKVFIIAKLKLRKLSFFRKYRQHIQEKYLRIDKLNSVLKIVGIPWLHC